MKGKYYTFFIASSASGGMRRVRVPFYVLHFLAILAAVGGITVIAASEAIVGLIIEVSFIATFTQRFFAR